MSEDGAVLASEELDAGYTHAENLHVFISEVMQRAGRRLQEIEAVCVSRGPGSYTGLRIGASTAKGLAYALNVPLIGIDTLRVMAAAADCTGDCLLVPMIDARRMEVYTAVYDQGLQTVIPARPLIIDASWEEQFPAGKNLCFFGNGMAKCRSILEKHPLSVFMDDIRPSAVHMVRLGEEKFQNGEFENTAYFEPFYLKEFQAGKPPTGG